MNIKVKCEVKTRLATGGIGESSIIIVESCSMQTTAGNVLIAFDGREPVRVIGDELILAIEKAMEPLD